MDSVPSLAQEALNQHFLQVCPSYCSGMAIYTEKKKKIHRASGRNREELEEGHIVGISMLTRGRLACPTR